MHQTPSKRYLILTADDYGASVNINEGISLAAEKKVITCISALCNFTESMPELKKLSDKHPEIGIGVHLNIVTGKPITPPNLIPSLIESNGSFFTIEQILKKLKKIPIDELKRELRAQIQALEKIDIKIDHLTDQYGILSLYSPFFDIVMELAREFHLPIRSPLIASVKYPDVFSNSEMNKNARNKGFKLFTSAPCKALKFIKYTRLKEMERKIRELDEFGIHHPDILITSFWGDPTPSRLSHILKNLPPGISELIFHFGSSSRQESYPSGLDLDYFEGRENELSTMTSENLKDHFHTHNLSPVRYSDLPALSGYYSGSYTI